MKFGGASLIAPEPLAQLVNIVEATPGQRVVVVSALAGVTDRLHEILTALDRNAIGGLVMELDVLHRSLAPETQPIDAPIARIMRQLERSLWLALGGGPVGARERDAIVCTGERLAAVLVAAHLRAAGFASRSFSSEDVGLQCDARFGEASVDYDATERGVGALLLPYLNDGGIPVVTGYYAISPCGAIATFGRSGTDYTATSLGRVLGAERVDLWKVVGGFLTADPRIVPEAQVIPQLSYEEAAELSFYGARVIHPRALDPARDRSIPVHILNVHEPDAPGSRITGQHSHHDGAVTAISSCSDLAMVRAYCRAAAGHQETMVAVGHRLADAGVNIMNTSTAQTSFGVLIQQGDQQEALEAIRSVPLARADRSSSIPGLALVCVVGHGLGETRGMVARLLCSIVRAGIEVEMVCAGASPVACHLTIPERDLETATRAIYGEFFAAHDVSERLCVYSKGSDGATAPGACNDATCDREAIPQASRTSNQDEWTQGRDIN